MVLNFSIPSPLERISDPEIAAFDVEVWVKRDDLIHPQVSGNKLRKLKYNIEKAKKDGKSTILTFGGAFSNHIYATAAAGKIFGLKTIGIIRGERVEPLNSTLDFVEQMGMELHFIDRGLYREKASPAQLDFYKEKFGDVYIIPEGGANGLAVKGCVEILEEISLPFDYVCCACGTGATLAGLVAGLKAKQHAIGFPVLKGGGFLQSEVEKLLIESGFSYNSDSFSLQTDYHFGGYAKWDNGLEEFIARFEKTNNIPLEPVYTGKLFFGLYDLIKKNYFPEGSKIVVLHTGGLR